MAFYVFFKYFFPASQFANGKKFVKNIKLGNLNIVTYILFSNFIISVLVFKSSNLLRFVW